MEESLQQMCRTCLSSDVALVSLLAQSSTYTVAEMLAKFTTVSITENDPLPKKVCMSCVSEIKRSYFFKIKCESSQDTLQQYVNEIQAATEELAIPKTEDDAKLHFESPKKILSAVEGFTIIHSVDSDINNQHQVVCSDLGDILVDDDDRRVPDKSNQNENIPVEIITSEMLDEQQQETVPNSDLDRILPDCSEDDDVDASGQQRIIILGCEECCNTFESQEEFDAHSADCGKVQIVKGKMTTRTPNNCPHCPMDFVHKKNLEKHILKCHSPQKVTGTKEAEPPSSEESGKKDDAPKSDEEDGGDSLLREIIPENSLLKHDPKSLPTGEFTCWRCGAGFAKKKSLLFHMKINKCTLEQFICKICEKVFISDKNLIKHLKTHEKAFKCGKCESRFSSKEKLQEHTKEQHKGVLKNQCTFCGKVFTMLSTLKDHLRIHSGEKPFLCSICGKGFSQNTNLKQHVMRHKNFKPYECNQCDCSFVSKGELNAHVRKHTGDHPFVCDICNSSFTTSSSLLKHKRIHTGERPYACDLCPMRFSALGTLKNHRRTHTGEKPYKCSFCPRTFTQRTDCIGHMRNHTGERPYICSVCGYGFSHLTGLKNHTKLHDKDQQKQATKTGAMKVIVEKDEEADKDGQEIIEMEIEDGENDL